MKFWGINRLKDIERFFLRLKKDNEIYNSPGKKGGSKISRAIWFLAIVYSTFEPGMESTLENNSTLSFKERKCK